MRADVAFETMEKLLPYLSNVINDEEGAELMRSVREKGKIPAGNVMQELLPLFLGPHKEDMFGIVSALKGCTVEEAKALDFKEINAIMRENFVGDMVLFFANCLTMARCM